MAPGTWPVNGPIFVIMEGANAMFPTKTEDMKRAEGTPLIGLLVVAMVIGLLATISIPTFLS